MSDMSEKGLRGPIVVIWGQVGSNVPGLTEFSQIGTSERLGEIG